MRGSTIFDDAQPACRDRISNSMIKHDHAIGNVFFQAVAGERTLAALSSDHRGYALFFEPQEEPAQFGPKNGFIRETGEQSFDSIEQDSFGADGIDAVV
jgi:hypothetical protein